VVRSDTGDVSCRNFKVFEAGEGPVCESGGAHDLSGNKVSLRFRIRSIQDFPPSQAIGFIFLLKRAIQEVLKSGIQEKPVLEEWLEFQSRIDQLTLLAFDIYMECREKICEIRVNEAKAKREMAFRLLERMNFIKGEPEKKEGVDS
jgi:hypothetical protein